MQNVRVVLDVIGLYKSRWSGCDTNWPSRGDAELGSVVKIVVDVIGSAERISLRRLFNEREVLRVSSE